MHMFAFCQVTVLNDDDDDDDDDLHRVRYRHAV